MDKVEVHIAWQENLSRKLLWQQAVYSPTDHQRPAQNGQVSDYGLFPRKGLRLESGRILDYYILHNGNYSWIQEMQRPQKNKMLDGAFNTIMVKDSRRAVCDHFAPSSWVSARSVLTKCKSAPATEANHRPNTNSYQCDEKAALHWTNTGNGLSVM